MTKKLIRYYQAFRDEEDERLHRQPRNLLKTAARSIANTRDEPTLFSLPTKVEPEGVIINAEKIKEEISKNTVGLALYLIQKYQENGSKPLEIENLAPLSEVMKCNNYRLKIYLLYLGGYVYPFVDKDEKTKELVLSNEQLFRVEFRYSERVANKYSIGEDHLIEGAHRIGTSLLNFIKDEPLERVIITPNEKISKALEGKGLGNILTVNDKVVGLFLGLTDIASKIFSYSLTYAPSHRIAEGNLVKHLGLEKQIKTQGKPRVRETILKGLQELQDKGHLKSFSYDEGKAMYSYTYSEKYARHPDGKRGKSDSPEGVQ